MSKGKRAQYTLKLSRPAAEVFIPDGTSWEAACTRVTHLVVAARADGAWLGARRYNTEPIVRLVVESRSAELVSQAVNRLQDI